ncbi:MAG TPA: amino acid adenylation domain-containing protein [Thermoanaerobaculia bacterium]|nr:amino acid adenylation domain-containing protein [Thermoanaerobaculia bacterium]
MAGCSTVVEVLRAWAAARPEAEAFVFLKDGEREAACRTYRDLDERARRIGALLQRRGLRGEPVLLLALPGPELVEAFLGCLYAGAIAVPAHPPGSGRALPRLTAIVQDARPAAVLASPALAVKAGALGAGEVLPFDAPADPEDWVAPDLDGDSPAFLQYTSGSTSSPKGVVVTHGNLFHNERTILQAFGTTAESTVMSWLPLQHDMGLIGGLLHPLFAGARCVLMSPAAFLQRPARWLEAITRYRSAGGTASGGPNFAYELCLRKVSAEERSRLDLSGWRVAFNGAEPVRAGTLERFAAAFAPCGFRLEAFRPCYGLAEATLLVSGGEGSSSPPYSGPVSCGLPWTEVEIVDPETCVRCGTGEIWVAGPGVAAGYWNRPEETEATFGARLADAPEAGPFLRTGDLGFLAGGELFVSGRLKDLVILRGRNHYPQDLERTAEVSHPALQPGGAAAFGVEVDGEEQLVIVQEVIPRFGGDAGAVAEAVREAVAAEHEVQPWEVVLVEPGSVPRTTSGKVRRQACRAAYKEGGLPVIACRRRPDLQDLRLRELVSRRTGMPPSEIDLEQPLTRLGLDSLTIMEIRGAVEAELGISLPLQAFTEATGSFPLSEGQKALWAAESLMPQSGVYNIAVAARVGPGLDVAKLREALRAVIARHPALRTRFTSSTQEVVPLAEPDLLEEEGLRLEEEAYRPFQLDSGRPLRVRIDSREGIVLFVVHHLVADFWSLAVVLRELAAFYEGRALLAPAVSYADWVAWQAGVLAKEGERLLGYWRGQIEGAHPLDLPADRRRPATPTFRAALHAFTFSPGLSDRILGFGFERDATLYVTLLAALQALLGRLGGQTDFLVGSPVAGRTRPELADVVGYFANPVPMRASLGGDPSFEEHLGRVRRTVLGALEHQEYPAALLPGRSLFQVLFVLQRAHGPGLGDLAGFGVGAGGARLRIGDVELESLFLTEYRSIFDLILSVAEGRDGIVGTLARSTDLFEAVTAERLLRQLEVLVAGALEKPGARLSSLPLLSAPEHQQLLVEWTDARTATPRDGLLHELFEVQADRTPDAVAAVFDDLYLSYGELEARANQVARHLRRRGVGPESLVGLCLERSLELVIGVYGILKAGAAYVPLDPEYPRERLLLMMEGVSLVLNREGWPEVSREDRSRPVSGVTGENAAYVMYTSGSTGRPKGVVIRHGGITSHMHWMDRDFPLDGRDCVLQKTPISFDASIWEFYAALMSGGRLALVRPGGHREPGYLADEIERHQVTVFQVVPSLLRAFLEEPELERRCRSLRWLICGGEALGPEVVERFFERLPGRLVNVYGPAEGSITATWWLCRPGEAVSIGRPIANAEIHLLDVALEPVPVGSAGELCLGGAGVGRGYLNRPELTAERFIPHPFGAPGERLYRTGDLARWTADGRLFFVSRLDHQVKVRGVRVEPGEVEAALLQHPGVREAAVVVRKERLAAYVVPRAEPPSHLREYLLERLPEPMVPSWFVALERLPLSPSGKVDREALPAPEANLPERGYVAPRTPAEEAVAGIWGEVMGLPRVGIHDNFFELGGHSLLATQVVSRVRRAFGVELPLRELFEAPTVAGVAECLNAVLWHQKKAGVRPAGEQEEVEL